MAERQGDAPRQHFLERADGTKSPLVFRQSAFVERRRVHHAEGVGRGRLTGGEKTKGMRETMGDLRTGDLGEGVDKLSMTSEWFSVYSRPVSTVADRKK